jgi:hypothetical protein
MILLHHIVGKCGISYEHARCLRVYVYLYVCALCVCIVLCVCALRCAPATRIDFTSV